MPPKNQTEFTTQIGETLCKILRRGNFRNMACAQVGISTDTLANWLRRGAAGEKPFEAFARDLMKAEAESEDLLVTGIRRAGSSDWRALAWILERSSSQRWGYKAQLQANLSDMMARESKRILNVVEKHAGPDVASKILADLIDEESGEGTAGGTAKLGPAGAGTGTVNERGVH